MREFKGTPGPWVVDIRGGCVAVYQNGRQKECDGCHPDDERNIAYSNKGAEYDRVVGYWSMDKKTIRDFTLMSAAPELLEALQKMIGCIEYYASLKESDQPNIEDWAYANNSAEVEMSRAAIAKALGK
ncbi:hypothetical protein ACHHZC_11080 [Citrobacter freundii complex sp. 2024EL-00228]|uniref:hypothetical protein n=1 Tax=unclassified Citrobacter freundii complex TaxID=2816438 RepID=UPI003615C535